MDTIKVAFLSRFAAEQAAAMYESGDSYSVIADRLKVSTDVIVDLVAGCIFPDIVLAQPVVHSICDKRCR